MGGSEVDFAAITGVQSFDWTVFVSPRKPIAFVAQIVPIPAGAQERHVALLIEAEADKPSGLAGLVTVQDTDLGVAPAITTRSGAMAVICKY